MKKAQVMKKAQAIRKSLPALEELS